MLYKRVNLTNIEYDFLYYEGGDGLIAFFAMLRATKEKEVIPSVAGMGICSTLIKATGISRTTIEKYLPNLKNIGLVNIHPNGNIAIRSRKWSDKNLPRLDNRKLIPIIICKKFVNTKTCVAFVRVHSNLEKQESQIRKKGEQMEVLREHLRGSSKSLKNYRGAARLLKNGKDIKHLSDSNCLNTTISNLGFHKLLKNSDLVSNSCKRIGHHFKTKLINMNLLTQKRDVRFVSPTKSKDSLDYLKSVENYGSYFFGTKGIYYEGTPRIELGTSPLVGNKKKRVRK